MTKTTHNHPKSIITPFLLLLFLLPAVLVYCGFFLPPQYHDTFPGEMKYKQERLMSTPGKRIVLIGGSSVPFSMKSDVIAAHFPEYEVVDFGLYADMGTVVMLDWARANVHEGDIYLIMPEQHEQTLSTYFSGENVWQALDGAFGNLPLLSSKRFEKLVAAFPAFAGRKLFYYVNGTPSGDTIYTRSSFNEYGDIACEGREYNIMEQGYNPNDPISFSTSVIAEDFIQEMNAFAQDVTGQGATVYYHFPAMNQLAVLNGTTRADIDTYYDYLKKKLDFPVSGNPHNSILDSGWFYDTNFHLNESGAIYYTRQMVEDLKILLQDTSPVDIMQVPMPESPKSASAPSEAVWDNSGSNCFTYEAAEQGLLINGLTSEGQNATCLVLPGFYEEQPVVGITEDLFLDCTALETLTIQSNIGILYDGMFQGCDNLKSLILTGAPEDYTVGSSLMGNASFIIYVPLEELDHYKRHYSWQKYSSYLSPLTDGDR